VARGQRSEEGRESGGTWYLTQAADGVWRMHARSHAALADLEVLAQLRGYPAVITPNGNLFHLGTPLRRMRAMLRH